MKPPTVSLDFSYYLTDGFNERALGFFVQQTGVAASSQRFANAESNSTGNFASGHLVSSSGANFYIVTSPDGEDLNKNPAVGLDTNDSVIGVGNCYVSDYSVELAVGSLPTVNVSVEGANMNSVDYSAGFEKPSGESRKWIKIYKHNHYPAKPRSKMEVSISKGGPITALRPGDIFIRTCQLTD